jgi:DNA-binding response OmpR family regulator
MKILLIENNNKLIKNLTQSLTLYRYMIDVAEDGETGWIYGLNFDYDLIILDIELPKIDGLRLCQRFRTEGFTTPILLLSSQSETIAKVRGLDAGADDYIVKPFDQAELFARIRSLLRRGSSNPLPILAWGDLLLNLSTYEVSYNSQPLELSTMEYGLLELLLRDSQHVFSTDEIIDQLWSLDQFPSEATVRSHIRRVRQKLVASGAPKDFISTVHGRGYYLKAPKIEESTSFTESAVHNQMPTITLAEPSLPQEDVAKSKLIERYYSLTLVVVSSDTEMNQALIDLSKYYGVHIQVFSILKKQAIQTSLRSASDALPQDPDAILFQLPSGSNRSSILNRSINDDNDYIEIWSMVKKNYPDVPIIVIAEHIDLSDRLHFMRWGVNYFLEFQNNPDKVIVSIIQFLNRLNVFGKVMVLDSDQDWLYSVETLLKPWGFKVTTLADTQQFWAVLKAVMPDALILDVNLPQISGLEVCQLLRSDPFWYRLPILFLSNLKDTITQNQAFKVGADDYLLKPTMGFELAHRIINRLQRRTEI